MPLRTTDQQIAELEARLARLRDRRRAADAAAKIVVGGMAIAAAKRDPEVARWVLRTIRSDIQRPADLARLQDLIRELEGRLSLKPAETPK